MNLKKISLLTIALAFCTTATTFGKPINLNLLYYNQTNIKVLTETIKIDSQITCEAFLARIQEAINKNQKLTTKIIDMIDLRLFTWGKFNTLKIGNPSGVTQIAFYKNNQINCSSGTTFEGLMNSDFSQPYNFDIVIVLP